MPLFPLYTHQNLQQEFSQRCGGNTCVSMTVVNTASFQLSGVTMLWVRSGKCSEEEVGRNIYCMAAMYKDIVTTCAFLDVVFTITFRKLFIFSCFSFA